MLPRLKNFWNSKRRRQFTDMRNVGLYIFTLIVVVISWSGVKTVQKNYELQKKISVLAQQNAVLKLQNENTALQNKYFETDQYLELAARQNLGLAAPGEQVLLVPKSLAMKYVDPSLAPKTNQVSTTADNRPKYIRNLEAWRDFLLGRTLLSD